ncbi:hypothetical protein GE061_015328 [Apolygus lucorum]|uniref:Uncharacterized protein n=1 Tax=Apolygus lucorum TaxID=248454 RepID=A0A8S9XKM9_APOLU|nr:hypothetical protein GE061_015328 [Apolygus lucorum]
MLGAIWTTFTTTLHNQMLTIENNVFRLCIRALKLTRNNKEKSQMDLLAIMDTFYDGMDHIHQQAAQGRRSSKSPGIYIRD